MPKKMLIDATHPEETRVVVVEGNKVEEFDFESLNKRQLAGNIYLAKVTRVEPSLQAAFIDYGGNRHGFLAFNEIHPDYYQIPVADREKLLAEEAEYAKALADEETRRAEQPKPRSRRKKAPKSVAADASDTNDAVITSDIIEADVIDVTADAPDLVEVPETTADAAPKADEAVVVEAETPAPETAETAPAVEATETNDEAKDSEATDTGEVETPETEAPVKRRRSRRRKAPAKDAQSDTDEANTDATPSTDDIIESVADDDVTEEVRPRKPRMKRYKIQEVVKVRQILLVQVVKEERGNKGAALTTYLSLAGRYCVLMPNTARGGGISRKITNAVDRKKIKAIANELIVPQGAGLISRTAGARRNKNDINRDYEFLTRQWEQIRELTLKSIAPAPIYEEGDLIKRSIRDLYTHEIDEIFIEGDRGYEAAKDYMTMFMPDHVSKVKQYKEPMPLFSRYQVESYLGAMFNPVVQLKSGGYLVIGITEALVAIDVNSGKATKESSIEETAVKTNLEAAEEVARQMRLRDLAGLIVIDFIDMEERRNNAAVEKRMKDKLKNDRARIQVGRISGFGLMEMSRQRLRPGMLEATTQPCMHCHGTGLLRSDDSLALSILRELEEEGVRSRTREVLIKAPVNVANYLLNAKREHIGTIETRFGLSVRIEADVSLIGTEYSVEKFKTATRYVPQPKTNAISMTSVSMDDLDTKLETPETPTSTPTTPTDDGEQPKKKSRRRRGGRGRGKKKPVDGVQVEGGEAQTTTPDANTSDTADKPAAATPEANTSDTADKPAAPTPEAEPKAVAAEPVKVVETPAEPVADKGAEPEKQAPKPRTRRKPAAKKPKAEPSETTPAASDDAVKEDAPKEVKKKPARKPRKKAVKKEVEAPAPVAVEPAPKEAAPTPVLEAVAEPAPKVEEAPKPAKPKRKGWWSRG